VIFQPRISSAAFSQGVILDPKPETSSMMTNKDLDFSRLIEEERLHIPCANRELHHRGG
jgi:hypothetical protein